ncbi:hypothetical protein LO763_22000 [Glycomyces sp. A-F 0318]|uniref:hypothetical protein n=1 Tax=Glycomyces amatae TaxID=2881355 RepID=UPI001E30479E|nr:hypothetical protein [Glycomyces amatae]MCD0446290.1 hypothetical protein [Glycomyces amatae]
MTRRKPKVHQPVPASAYGRKHANPEATKLVLTDAGVERRMRYTPGRIHTDVAVLFQGAQDASIEFALTIVPAAVLLSHYQGKRATVCAQVCIQLADVLALLGITSYATPVTVALRESGQVAFYGAEAPRWEGNAYVGHCVLYIPSCERFIDATVQQFDGFQQRMGPYTGPIGATRDGGPLAAGHETTAMIDGRVVSYTVVPGGDALVRYDELLAVLGEQRPRSAAYMAGQVIDALRQLDLASRIPEQFSRVRALLETVGDAPVVDSAEEFRFVINGEPRWIDELAGHAG